MYTLVINMVFSAGVLVLLSLCATSYAIVLHKLQHQTKSSQIPGSLATSVRSSCFWNQGEAQGHADMAWLWR